MSRQTSTRFSFLLNLASSASLPGGTFSYTWLSDGTKVSARADDGTGNGVQKRYFGSFVYTSNAGFSTGMRVPGNIYFVKHQIDILEKVYLRNNIKS